MVDAFETISFLTRSENRVTVLRTLGGGPYTKRELVAETGVSDVTIKRVLEDFRERGWAIAVEDGYERTRLGDLLAEDYGRLHESMDLACRLGPVRDLFPVEEMAFDLRHLAAGRVSDPDDHDVMRTMDRARTLIREADHIVVVSNMASESVAEAVVDAIEDGADYRGVWGAEQVAYARENPSFGRLVAAMLDAGAEIHWTEAVERPMGVAAYGDLGTLAGFDESGALRAGIESRAAPVVEWIHETYERYRADATPLTRDDLDG
jgi:predicted transcriptional regulator